jgi:hypothetical protein
MVGALPVTSAHGLSGYDRNANPSWKEFASFPRPGYRSGMASVVFLTTRAPATLIDDLILAGHRAWECLSVSEVLYICEQQCVDVVVIAAEVEDADVVEAQLRHITIRLKPKASSKDLIWELTKLFPDCTATAIQ